MAQHPDEDRIRRKAHELWVAEGHPHGRDRDHWAQAREIIAIEDSMETTLLPRNTGSQEPVEPNEAVASLGDLPNLTDQGEHALTDTAREPTFSSTPRATGDTAGAVARPAQASAPGGETETVSKPVTPAAVASKPAAPPVPPPAPKPAPAVTSTPVPPVTNAGTTVSGPASATVTSTPVPPAAPSPAAPGAGTAAPAPKPATGPAPATAASAAPAPAPETAPKPAPAPGKTVAKAVSGTASLTKVSRSTRTRKKA